MSDLLQQVNLYVDEIRVDRDWLDFSLLMKATGGLLAFMLLITLFLSFQLYRAKMAESDSDNKMTMAKKKLEDFGLDIEANKRLNANLPQRIDQARKDLENKHRLLEYLATQKSDQEKGFSALLTSLSVQSVPGVWLTGITVTDSGKGMQLQGKTIDPSNVPVYLKKLNKEPAIAGRDFDVMKFKRDKKDQSSVGFTLQSGDVKKLAEYNQDQHEDDNQKDSSSLDNVLKGNQKTDDQASSSQPPAQPDHSTEKTSDLLSQALGTSASGS